MKAHRADIVGRVIDVSIEPGGVQRIILLAGETPYEVVAESTAAVGDAFLLSPGNPPRLLQKIGGAATDGWTSDCDGLRWRMPDARGRTRFATLWQRHRMKKAVRDYFDREGFIEIDTPLLVHGTTPDATIQSFTVGDRYLVTSSEYQIKRLEVGGFDKIYTLTQNYRRDDGAGRFRNPEFTMLEWARVGQTLADIENDAESLTLAAHKALEGSGSITYGGHHVDLTRPWKRQTVRDAIAEHADVCLSDFSLASIQRAVRDLAIAYQSSWESDIYFLFSLLMDYIQPCLGQKQPVFIQDWPSFQTSSTQEKSLGTAERSELFIAGVEISDGFPSLTSFERQLQTFAHQNERRKADDLPHVTVDQFYLSSLRAGLPRGAGMALGFDRLVMLLTDSQDVRDVLAFGWDEV